MKIDWVLDCYDYNMKCKDIEEFLGIDPESDILTLEGQEERYLDELDPYRHLDGTLKKRSIAADIYLNKNIHKCKY